MVVSTQKCSLQHFTYSLIQCLLYLTIICVHNTSTCSCLIFELFFFIPRKMRTFSYSRVFFSPFSFFVLNHFVFLQQMYPIIWQGVLALKNDSVAIQMHVVSGNSSVAFDALPKIQDGYQPLLRIAQRMRLEQAQLDGVNRKMEVSLS